MTRILSYMKIVLKTFLLSPSVKTTFAQNRTISCYFSGEEIATLHADKEAGDDDDDVMHAKHDIKNAITISEEPPESQTLVYEILK